MNISKDTKLCISIAERPGNFGASIFNCAFNRLNIDFVYKPLMVKSDNLASAISGIRSLGIRGCGVSMPHKTAVIKYLDEINRTALSIGAVNTIVNNNGILVGYNTDYLGIKKAIVPELKMHKKILIIGAGGFARAALTVLKEFNLEIYLSSRDQLIGSSLSKEFGVNFLEFSKKDSFSADILINATPVGMGGSDEMIITKDAISNFLVIVDAVVSETRLAKEAESIGLKIIRGGVLAINQAIEQFYLYTGVELPKELTEEAIIN